MKVKYYFIIIDTKVSEKVSSRILNKIFCSDVKNMSPMYQTNACEAFHSVVNHFAPKSTAFSYKGIYARYALQVWCYCAHTGLILFCALMEREGLTLEHLYNCDETGLCYKMLPTKTIACRTEKEAPEIKKMKERVTLMACANATGNTQISTSVYWLSC